MASETAAQNFERALKLIKVERVFEAVPLLDQIIQAEPDWAEAYVQRARVRKRLGDRERAIADYSKAIKLAPTAQTYLARALLWLEMEQLKGAIADSRQAIALNPELAGGHRLLAKALERFGDGLGAIAAYKQAARCYIEAGDKENAQKCIEAISQIKAASPLQSLQPEAESTGAHQQTDSEQSATPDDYVQRVQARYEAGEYAAAKKDLDWLLSVNPNHAKALCLRGLIQARLGNRAAAVADLALAGKQHAADSVEGRAVRFARGQMRLILNDGYGAIEEFSALIDSAAEQTEARLFMERGHSYRLMNNLDQAFKDYSNAIALDADNPLLYELRAEMQQSMGASESAIEDFQKAATLWLDVGNWQKHQQVVEAVRSLRQKKEPRKVTATGGSVPIKSYHRQLPVVEVLLDGIAKYDVVIDRNAPNSIITQQMANQLNLNLVSYRYVYLADGTPMELSIARLRSVVIGETIVTDVYVAIAPDHATVVLGKDCFSGYSIRISGNEITFLRG